MLGLRQLDGVKRLQPVTSLSTGIQGMGKSWGYIHLTYISFARSIYDSYKRLDRFADERKVHFSAQDDQWVLHFKRRCGIPLSQLKSRLEVGWKITGVLHGHTPDIERGLYCSYPYMEQEQGSKIIVGLPRKMV